MVRTREGVVVVLRFLGLFWAVELINFLLGWRLDAFGIRPRQLSSLPDILFAPFLHDGFAHLLANTVPFALFGFLTTRRRKADFYVVFAAGTLLGGLGTWLFGRDAVHLGASGVIFAFLGFLMGRGLFEQGFGAVVLSVVVTVLWGGMLWQITPFVGAGISWEGHLFGFLSGVWVARALGRGVRRRST